MARTTERRWTDGQSAAIDTHGKTLLVSAAAGSGKTATLTERIIRSLTDKNAPADISKMLIVTFTKAAAQELKERIFSALGKALAESPADRHLNEQLIKLGSANICTIDAFYLNLIRQNFSTLGISASCRIADPSELDLLKRSVMDEVIEHFYDSDLGFSSLADCFVGTKSVNDLALPLLSLYETVSSYPTGVDYLIEKAEELDGYAESKTDLFDTEYGKFLLDDIRAQLKFYSDHFSVAYEYSMSDADVFAKRALTYESDKKQIDTLLDAISGNGVKLSEVRPIFLAYSPSKLGSVASENETAQSLYYKTKRDDIKEGMLEINAKLFSRTDEAICSEMLETSAYVKLLHALLREFSDRLTEEKNRRNIMEFSDIRRLTFRLLVEPDGSPTETAKRYSEQFTDIYIDEYQDVDKVQDMIFSALSRDNRFMVGDIKQSIYSFRGAEPQVFADYRRSFFHHDEKHPERTPEDIREITIFMSENFRCDKNIIEFTNLVCSRLFGSCAKSIGYTSADDLRFSKLLPREDYESPKVEVSVILTGAQDTDDGDTPRKKKKRTDEPTSSEIEAEYIAKEIDRLIKTETKADGSPILPGDIAVIYRSNDMVAPLSEALRKRDILCSAGGGDEYFESPDVLLVLSFLNIIDNPHRDIHLAGTLCSPLFEFSFDEIVRIRLGGDLGGSLYDAILKYAEGDCPLAIKCKHFEDTLSSLRSASRSLPVDRFLRILFESEVFAATGLLTDRNDYGEGGNLMRLYEYARTFEAGSFKGLYNFIEFINSLIEKGKVLEVAAKDRSSDRVNLTTMHHSKGLEFPVCFVCGIGRRRNTKDQKKSLVYEYSLGVAMKLSDKTGFARVNTPLRDSIERLMARKSAEEEMRILYVAMTRARERLYLVATSNKTEEALMTKANMQSLISSPYAINSCTSFLDWVLLPFADTSIHSDCCTLNFIRREEIYATENEVGEQLRVKKERVEPDKELYESLCEKFDFSYGYSDLVRVPAKMSVSRLSPDILDENDTSADIFELDEPTRIPDLFVSDKPSQATAAERGTATHLFLQFCDLGRIKRHGVAEEIAYLVEKRFFPQSIADLIYDKELESFADSELARKISSAKRIIREQRFNLLLPAEAFSSDGDFSRKLQNEILAVQGVIDLIIIDAEGNIELYDYKTDRLSREELEYHSKGEEKMNERHGLQLSYYAHAVSELFGKKCSRVCVYSTHSAQLYDIKEVPLKINYI